MYPSRNGFSFLTTTTERRDRLGPYDRGACLVCSEVCNAVMPARRWKQTDFRRFDAQRTLCVSCPEARECKAETQASSRFDDRDLEFFMVLKLRAKRRRQLGF